MKKIFIFLIIFLNIQSFTLTAQDKIGLAQKKAREIVRQIIKPHYTEFEKILLLHEYITDNVSYGLVNNETSAYTALIHNRADCVGFARSLDILFKTAGLDSFSVVRRKGHLWVRVKLNGKYYNIDPTWSALKSNWAQYGWFLLSDRQNIDSGKGLIHVLDSGENYPAAHEEYVFSERDYIHKQELKCQKKLRLIGRISLPGSETAPEAGIIGHINGNRFSIPAGKNSATFIASIDRNNSNPALHYYFSDNDENPKYVKQGFYSRNETVIGYHNAYHFNMNSLDKTGLTLTLIPAKHYITGRVYLPSGVRAPKNGINFSIEMKSNDRQPQISYYTRAFIPENQNSATYRIDISKLDKSRKFRLYYYSPSANRSGYNTIGFYSQGNNSSIEIINDYLKNIDLPVLPRIIKESQLKKLNAKIVHVNSMDSEHPANYAIDGNPETFWHTKWRPDVDPMPHSLVIDLGRELDIRGLTYLPRQDMANGRIGNYEILIGTSKNNCNTLIHKGRFPNTNEEQRVIFTKPVKTRFLKLIIKSEVQGNHFASLAELDVILK